MNEKQKAFQQKVKNRKFTIDHSWRGSAEQGDNVILPMDEGQCLWNLVNENLAEANARKFRDPFFSITSHRRKLGRIIVFLKKAIRKLMHIFLGWYLFPIYEQQNIFNGKILNTVALERDLIVRLENRINSLEVANAQLHEALQAEENKLGEAKALLVQESTAREQAFGSLHQTLMQESTAREHAVASLLQTLNQETEVRAKAVDALKESLGRLENLPTSDDEFYHHFEEKFRGSREEIINRLSIYVPILQEHLPDWSQARFIDIGSGRGEWLDIIRHYGAVNYVGVDLNARQNAIAEEHGHKTVCRDCIEYLSEQPDNSVDLISGIQIIEHLCMSDLMELLKQSHRVLKSGGMILFETPNPRNISVAAYAFYNDPSHKRPLDPGLMSFIAEWTGFKKVKCIDANSSEGSVALQLPEEMHSNQLTKAVNDIKWVLFGPMDYALFAVKE